MGQVDNLRGGWLPPPFGFEPGTGPIDNRPQLTKLPHKVSTCISHVSASLISVPCSRLDGNCNKSWAHKRSRELLRGADRSLPACAYGS